MKLQPGRLEVVTGPMFAGKTEELIRRVRRAAIARRRVQVFTHAVDRRNRVGIVSSHTGLEFPSTPVSSALELEAGVAPETALVAVDEAQFFGGELLPVADRLAKRGIDVIIAGLDVTFSGEPFEPLPSLMALAENVVKLTAVCAVCGADAIYHQRHPATPRGHPRPVEEAATAAAPEYIGGLEKYEARCRLHFDPQGLAAASP